MVTFLHDPKCQMAAHTKGDDGDLQVQAPACWHCGVCGLIIYYLWIEIRRISREQAESILTSPGGWCLTGENDIKKIYIKLSLVAES